MDSLLAHVRPARYIAGLLCVALAPLGGVRAADAPAVVILATRSPSNRAAAQRIAEVLRRQGTPCETVELDAGDEAARGRVADRLRQNPPRLIVTGGMRLTEQALHATRDVPVVFFLTPNAVDAPLLAETSPYHARVAGVTSDIPPEQLAAWVGATGGKGKRVAVLCSARSIKTAQRLAEAGRRAGVKITPLRAERDRFPDAIAALNRDHFDGVLMIPDAAVYNGPNIRRLLLWGLRRKRCVWTFSEKVVKAGALAGIYSDPRQVGEQTAAVVRRILGGTPPAQIGWQYSRTWRRAVNTRTAKMIGVALGSAAHEADVRRYGGK